MTTPAVTDSQDVPLAQVSTFGLSEITLLLTLIGSVCTALFGKDFGISAHLQDIAGQAVILLPIALGLFRAIKHHGVAKANAIVLAQQTFNAVQQARHAAPVTPTAAVTSTPAAPAVSVEPHPLDGIPATSSL